VLSSDVVIACRGGAGTLSEIALALKANKTVILVDFELGGVFDQSEQKKLVHVTTPEEAISLVKNILKDKDNL
jgi:predicted Rossmann-fold nucleotide-binding protein